MKDQNSPHSVSGNGYKGLEDYVLPAVLLILVIIQQGHLQRVLASLQAFVRNSFLLCNYQYFSARKQPGALRNARDATRNENLTNTEQESSHEQYGVA